MAENASKLKAHKAAATAHITQLPYAPTRDEALDMAIGAVENIMAALKLSSDVEEMRQLKAQCDDILTTAHRIKSDEEWLPQKPQLPPEATVKQVNQWAVDVAASKVGVPIFSESSSRASSSRAGTSSYYASAEDSQIISGKPNISSVSKVDKDEASSVLRGSSRERRGPTLMEIFGSSYGDTGSLHCKTLPNTYGEGDNSYGDQKEQIDEPSQLGMSAGDQSLMLNRQSPLPPAMISGELTSLTPSATPWSHIRRLAEPMSVRKRSTKENIILLKASMVNGFKCPPWDKPPSTSDFALSDNNSVFVDTHDLSLSPYQQQFFHGWARAPHAIPPPSMYPEGRPGVGPLMSSTRPIDLVQDAASDCSVVASLCAGIARAERGHDQILSTKLYPYDAQLGKPVPSKNGKYVVRLNFNGCWRKVVIDDRLPVSSTHRLLHVLDRRNPALLWPALLEKAYLKVRGGYDFPGSNSCSDLWTLTGWIPEQVFLQETDTIPHQLWSRIYNAFTWGDVLMTVGTGKMSSRQERELGLEGQHSYVVLDMKETDHDRLLLIKNPWVEGRGWRGPRPTAITALDKTTSSENSANSLEAYYRDSIPTIDRPHPTTFWIGLEQVIQHFESLYLNWNPGLFRHRQDIHFDWKLEGQAPGNCIVHNPQFAFTLQASGPVWFLLSRHFRDNSSETKEDSDTFNDGSVKPDSQMNVSGDAPKGYMSIYVCDGKGERLYMKDAYLESSDYVSTPQCLLRWDAKAKTTYTVVIDHDDLPPSLYTFSLSAFSNSAITLEPVTDRYEIQRTEEGAWTRQTAGGGTGSSKYFENPQYTLQIEQRTSIALLLTSKNHEHPLHVKLALGYGKRLYRLQTRDVLTDSGDHRSGCVFAEIKDLQPGLYTVICSLFEPGQTGEYTLRIDTNHPLTKLQSLPRDGAGLLSKTLAPGIFGSQVDKIIAPLYPHRLASYTIIARFLRATSPRSMDFSKLARSPFRLSIELGRGPERKFVVASEAGEYSDLATVRCESVNIDPIVGKRGELWIVLDRLSGPGGPIEEWYDVEIFTDVPDACSIGVWRNWE